MSSHNLFKPPEHDAPRPLRSKNISEEEDAETWKVVEPLYRAAAWLRMIGVLFLVFCVLGIVETVNNNNFFALIIVVFPLWAAFALIHGGKRIQQAYQEGNRRMFRDAADKVRISATLSAWIMVAYIVLIVSLLYIFPKAF